MSKYLKARIVEGTDVWYERSMDDYGEYKYRKTDTEDFCITAACDQEGYNSLYDIGKKLWDSGLCSKFEIAAFDDGRMFWHQRPDKSNFERNSYKSGFEPMIKEEYQSFSSVDFQNDKLEMEYLQEYQNKFWNNRTIICSVRCFDKMLEDTLEYADFKVAREWVDKQGFHIPRDIGFEFLGTKIKNPFVDESMRFKVEPFSYYGVENMKSYMEQVKKKIAEPVLDSDCKPLDGQIADAQKQQHDVADSSKESKALVQPDFNER